VHAALAQLAEQDPLINLRQDDRRQELSVSLYGEVQKEVIEATLADDFGLEVGFRETTMICVERPNGIGDAVETIGRDNPFLATVGLRVEPAPIGEGFAFRLDAPLKRSRCTSTDRWTSSARRWRTPSGTRSAKGSMGGR
jgi:ribosomal protection tetracycline resistance protein